jgi:hypothetical protein
MFCKTAFLQRFSTNKASFCALRANEALSIIKTLILSKLSLQIALKQQYNSKKFG